MGNHESIKKIISKFSGQANQITIPRIYLDLLDGDYPAAALLNQIVYWSDKARIPGGWFYHSKYEWLEELCLTYFQVKRATLKLLNNQWIECHVRRANGTPTMHYRVNMDNLTNSVNKFLESQVSRKSINLTFESKETSLSESKETSLSESKETSLSESKETSLSLTKIKPEIKPKIKTKITATPPTPQNGGSNGGGGGNPLYDDLENLGIHKGDIIRISHLAKSKGWTPEEVYNEYQIILADRSISKPVQVLNYRINNCAPSPLPSKVDKDPEDPSKFLVGQFAQFFKTE